jgi:hypothetical protein
MLDSQKHLHSAIYDSGLAFVKPWFWQVRGRQNPVVLQGDYSPSSI